MKAKPGITWPVLEAIPEGTALGGAQLNATASVPGTIVYTPGAGQVLPPGTHVISATITPADSNLYIAAVASKIRVLIGGKQWRREPQAVGR